MSSFADYVDILGLLVKGARVIANIGRPQLVKQLNAIRLNLEQFKQAALEDNTSKMTDLLAECEVLSEELKNRALQFVDAKTNRMLNKTIKRARARKSVLLKERRQSRTVLQEAFEGKRAGLKTAMTTMDRAEREELLAELDIAIGRLRGMATSLENAAI